MPFGLLSSFQEDICFIVMKYILKIILSCHRWPIAGTEHRSNYPQGILDLIIRTSYCTASLDGRDFADAID